MGVAGNARPLQPFFLHGARFCNARTDSGGRLGLCLAGKLLEINGRHFDMKIQAVKQRAGYPRKVARRRPGRTGTAPGWMAEIAAGARVHRTHEHHAAGVGKGACHAGNCDHSILDRLAQGLHCRAGELRQLIKKEHTVVRK